MSRTESLKKTSRTESQKKISRTESLETIRKISLPAVLAVTVAGMAIFPATAAAGRAIETSAAQALSINNDGSKVLEQMTNHVKQLGAYKFDGYLSTLKEKESKINTGNFFFKPTSLMRVEVTGSGFKSGSILVKKKDGTVTAKGGPALLGMKMTLEPNSHMLTLPNGLNILECDLLSLMQGLHKQLASGQKIYATDTPVQVDNNQVIVLEARDAAKTPSQRILVDPKQMVPVEWLLFRDGKVFSTVRFNNFQVIPNMEEKIFEL